MAAKQPFCYPTLPTIWRPKNDLSSFYGSTADAQAFSLFMWSPWGDFRWWKSDWPRKEADKGEEIGNRKLLNWNAIRKSGCAWRWQRMALFSKGMYAIVGNTTLTKPFFFNEKNSVLEKRYILTALKTTLITSFLHNVESIFCRKLFRSRSRWKGTGKKSWVFLCILYVFSTARNSNYNYWYYAPSPNHSADHETDPNNSGGLCTVVHNCVHHTDDDSVVYTTILSFIISHKSCRKIPVSFSTCRRRKKGELNWTSRMRN